MNSACESQKTLAKRMIPSNHRQESGTLDASGVREFPQWEPKSNEVARDVSGQGNRELPRINIIVIGNNTKDPQLPNNRTDDRPSIPVRLFVFCQSNVVAKRSQSWPDG